MKPTDKAIRGMVSELPGRNESEPIGGLDRNYSEGQPPWSGEGCMMFRKLTDAKRLSIS